MYNSNQIYNNFGEISRKSKSIRSTTQQNYKNYTAIKTVNNSHRNGATSDYKLPESNSSNLNNNKLIRNYSANKSLHNNKNYCLTKHSSHGSNYSTSRNVSNIDDNSSTYNNYQSKNSGISSVNPYFEKRHIQTQEKLNKIKLDNYVKQKDDYLFAPKISENSRKIVENLIKNESKINGRELSNNRNNSYGNLHERKNFSDKLKNTIDELNSYNNINQKDKLNDNYNNVINTKYNSNRNNTEDYKQNYNTDNNIINNYNRSNQTNNTNNTYNNNVIAAKNNINDNKPKYNNANNNYSNLITKSNYSNNNNKPLYTNNNDNNNTNKYNSRPNTTNNINKRNYSINSNQRNNEQTQTLTTKKTISTKLTEEKDFNDIYMRYKETNVQDTRSKLVDYYNNKQVNTIERTNKVSRDLITKPVNTNKILTNYNQNPIKVQPKPQITIQRVEKLYEKSKQLNNNLNEGTDVDFNCLDQFSPPNNAINNIDYKELDKIQKNIQQTYNNYGNIASYKPSTPLLNEANNRKKDVDILKCFADGVKQSSYNTIDNYQFRPQSIGKEKIYEKPPQNKIVKDEINYKNDYNNQFNDLYKLDNMSKNYALQKMEEIKKNQQFSERYKMKYFS